MARTELDPEGTVFVEGELWSATCMDGAVAPGDVLHVLSAISGGER